MAKSECHVDALSFSFFTVLAMLKGAVMKKKTNTKVSYTVFYPGMHPAIAVLTAEIRLLAKLFPNIDAWIDIEITNVTVKASSHREALEKADEVLGKQLDSLDRDRKRRLKKEKETL